jgi:hypothetical protein
MIKIRNAHDIKILLSDFKNIDFNSLGGDAKNPELIKKITIALADDILFLRDDIMVEANFFFSHDDFVISMDKHYSIFQDDGKFTFKYHYEDEENIVKILSDSINEAIDDHDVRELFLANVKNATKFFNYLSLIDDVLDYKGKLFTHFQKQTFYSKKETFDFFAVEKSMRESPFIRFKSSRFSIQVYHEHITLDFDGLSLEINPDKIKGSPQMIIRNMMFNLYHSIFEEKVTNIDEFKMIVGLVSL